LDPSLASSYNNLGNAYDDEGMTDKAVEQYQIALKLRPDDAVIHFNLGVAYGRSGLKTKSIEELQAALRIKRDYVEARRAIDFLTKSERKTDASTAPSNK
jgi:tetratricopeptide (TPR) repeat protein